MTPARSSTQIADGAKFVRAQLPAQGLFADQDWRVALRPFPLAPPVVKQLQQLGRVLLQFNRAANLLYRQSATGQQPRWIAEWLDRGKPPELIELQRHPAFKNDVPRVIRPDILLAEDGLRITELDSVPGGIGLTAWLNQTYSKLEQDGHAQPKRNGIIGGSDGMIRGFSDMFGPAPRVQIIVSEESRTYRPEMEWLAQQLGTRFAIRDAAFSGVATGDAVYRFFELFDLPNISTAEHLFGLATQKQIQITAPPKAFLEEKLWFALLWNKNLHEFWRRELGASFLKEMQALVPYTWIVDPTPIPPHAAIPELNLTNWQQLKTLSQRERALILKVSGFSPSAWGARGVFLGNDLSLADWSEAVDRAIDSFPSSPYILQRFHKPKALQSGYYDFSKNEPVPMLGRVRLCPYYFVIGEGDAARAELSGILATICPADKKIIHGMRDAVLAPCAIEEPKLDDA